MLLLPAPKQPHPLQLTTKVNSKSNQYSMSSSAKKRKLNNDDDNAHGNQYDDYMEMRTNQTSLTSLGRSVTPPLTTRMRRTPFKKNDEELSGDFKGNKTSQNHRPKIGGRSAVIEEQHRSKISPIQLTNIRDLPSGYNVDTVKLHDILGDPMIRECWHFNYCFDIDFVMDQFDQDVRNLVRVKIVHGSWKQDSANRIRIDVRPTNPTLSYI